LPRNLIFAGGGAAAGFDSDFAADLGGAAATAP
jgi:hypothetical protein